MTAVAVTPAPDAPRCCGRRMDYDPNTGQYHCRRCGTWVG
jgi:tRNA(Ile2) C34 agmatinyltransferase TiaS